VSASRYPVLQSSRREPFVKPATRLRPAVAQLRWFLPSPTLGREMVWMARLIDKSEVVLLT